MVYVLENVTFIQYLSSCLSYVNSSQCWLVYVNICFRLHHNPFNHISYSSLHTLHNITACCFFPTQTTHPLHQIVWVTSSYRTQFSPEYSSVTLLTNITSLFTHICVCMYVHVYMHISIYCIKLKSHLSVCPSVCIFGMLITRPCQHGLKWDLFEVKAVSLGIAKFIFTSL